MNAALQTLDSCIISLDTRLWTSGIASARRSMSSHMAGHQCIHLLTCNWVTCEFGLFPPYNVIRFISKGACEITKPGTTILVAKHSLPCLCSPTSTLPNRCRSVSIAPAIKMSAQSKNAQVSLCRLWAITNPLGLLYLCRHLWLWFCYRDQSHIHEAMVDVGRRLIRLWIAYSPNLPTR